MRLIEVPLHSKDRKNKKRSRREKKGKGKANSCMSFILEEDPSHLSEGWCKRTSKAK
jgi:hypothetical protein